MEPVLKQQENVPYPEGISYDDNVKTHCSQMEIIYPTNQPVYLSNHPTFVQAALEVSQAGDRYENEADAIAGMVMSKSINKGEKSICPVINCRSIIQRSGESSITVTPKMENQLHNLRGSGIGLPSTLRSQMEESFGFDFDAVRIHTGTQAEQMSRDINAKAFTHRNDIYFNNGQYNPNSNEGQHLLAHELAHVVQQEASVTGNLVLRWPWNKTLEEQKKIFINKNYGPITYRRSDIIGSGFEASYTPASRTLNVTVRGKVRFADTLINSGGIFSSPNLFMNQSNGFITIMYALPPDVQAQIIPFLQWTETEKQIHMVRLKQNLEAVASLWQNTHMSFQVNETGWEDVTAIPNINLNITEGDAVHQTRKGGFFNLITQTDEATSDHLQIEIVKQPSVADVANIQQIITRHNATVGAAVNYNKVRGVRSYLGNDRGSRGSLPEGFNNFMSLESDRMDDPGEKIFKLHSVFFANNESTLSAEAVVLLDDFFNNPLILLDNAGRSVDINLYGFASAPGSTRYNHSLVERRISSVKSYIDNKITESNINTRINNNNNTNNSDINAEIDLISNPETHDPAKFRRVDIDIIRRGRGGQNVMSHEFGHVFGLGDEYEEVGNGYNRPAGTKAKHDQLAKDAGVSGGAVVGNDNRMMSVENVMGAAHYSTFANALKQLTSKQWKIVT